MVFFTKERWTSQINCVGDLLDFERQVGETSEAKAKVIVFLHPGVARQET